MVVRSGLPILLGAAAGTLGCLFASAGIAAVEPAEPGHVQVAAPFGRPVLDGSAVVRLRFLPDGGPGSGAVRVELTPESRALTLMEARSAAEQAFLEALDEPGLGGPLSRVTVVVWLMPDAVRVGGTRAETVVFVRKNGREWSVLAGD